MKSRFFTKKSMRATSVRIPTKDLELLKTAAAREEVAQSHFLREAIRERARRVLYPKETSENLGK